MKKIAFIFASSLLLLVGCQETTRTNNNSSCTSPYNCNGYQGGYNTGGYNTGGYTTGGYNTGGYTTGGVTGVVTGGVTGGVTGSNPYMCFYYPYLPECNGGVTTTGGVTGGNGTNPWPNYYSTYIDKNWSIQYPYVPSISCSSPTSPSNIDYTPYDTRKATITLSGANGYDPSSGQQFLSTTSLLLRTKDGAKQFLWGDSILKVRFKANIQPDYRNTTNVCPNRSGSQSTLKGYGKLRFNLVLVGVDRNGKDHEISSQTIEAKVNSCSTAIDLSGALEQYDALYFKVQNVQSNQNWWADNRFQANSQQLYDSYGFITPENKYVESTWGKVRDAECWSLDVEVASDGTKTF